MYIGKWKVTDKGETGHFTLTKDGYATFEFNGKIIGGKSSIRNGIEVSMTYVVKKKTAFTT